MTLLIRTLVVAVLFIGSTAHAALQIQTWTMDNGARVLFVESRSIPILDISVDFDAGARRDPTGKAGTAAMTNAMLARGVQEMRLSDAKREPALSEAQLSDAFADIAAQFGSGAGEDKAGVTLRTLSSAAERTQAVQLVARLLAQPSFPADLLARDKARVIANLREELTQPEAIADKAFWRAAYQGHPYAMIETAESIEAITRDDIVAFHRAHYVANRAVIAMIGAISRQEAEAIASELTRRLPQGAPLPDLPPVVQGQGEELRIAHPATQSHILVGMPAVAYGDPDWFALTVGNYVLGGGGFVSRLMQEVREKRGLAYGSYSYFIPMAQEGPFQVGLQTQKQQTNEALAVVNEVLSSYLKEGPTAKEIQAAKDNLIGGFALRIDNNRKILSHIAAIGYYGLPLDYLDTWTDKVAKVSAADVLRAFNRQLDMGRMTTVVVGAEK